MKIYNHNNQKIVNFIYFTCIYISLILLGGCIEENLEETQRPLKKRKLNNSMKYPTLFNNEKEIKENKLRKIYPSKKRKKNLNLKITKKRKFNDIESLNDVQIEKKKDKDLLIGDKLKKIVDKNNEYDFAFTMKNNKKMPYMEYIRSGKKPAEGRVNSRGYSKLKKNDKIWFYNHKEGIICKIKYINKYNTFREMVIAENPIKLLPQILNFKNIKKKEYVDEAVRIYKSFPKSYRVETFGCIAIGLKWLNDKKPDPYKLNLSKRSRSHYRRHNK